MTRGLATVIAIALLGSGCRLFQSRPGPWNPVLEPTDFVYLESVTSEANSRLESARTALRARDVDAAGQSLDAALQSIAKLQFYYIPMTEVRQLVYDADRLQHLGRREDAARKLDAAKSLLVGIAGSDGPILETALEEPIAEVDALLRAVQESRDEAAQRFHAVGSRINLMTLKGELIVGEARFHAEP